jgi:rod shape-determining protein MreD
MPTLSPKQIYFSLLLALLCQLLPWAGFGLVLRPDFVLLVVLYWLLRAPNICNIGTAWVAGLVVDLASGGIFGQNALAYALTAYFAVSYHRRLALFNIWQQTSYVFVLLILTQITLLILKMFAGGETPGWSYFLPSVSGILLWQMVIFSRIGVDAPPHKN